jgi:heme a synthase
MNNQGGSAIMHQQTFARFAWGLLLYNLLVILWGAFVRATGSGAGCGSHWPLCNGEVVPRAPSVETLIEFSHRLTSGLALLGAIALVVWAWRAFPPAHRVRRGAVVSLVFLVVEALIGAGLVLLEYVAANDSLARAYWMAGHLLNTFLLLGALTLTAWWASGGPALRLRGQGKVTWVLGAALLSVALLGASGGITALGDTLMLTAGLTPEASPMVAVLRDLRISHPILAFVVGAVVAGAVWLVGRKRSSSHGQRLGRAILALYVGQLLLGALNVALKAPVWLQLTHLLLADLIWIGLVLLAATALAEQPEPVVERNYPPQPQSTGLVKPQAR